MKRVLNLAKFIKLQGGEIHKTKPAIYGPDYRGLHATTDIAENEEILRIPISIVISANSLKNSGNYLKLMDAKIFDTKWENLIYPLLFVLYEMKCKENSFYCPYFDALPKSFDSHPAFFNETQRNLVKGSSFIEYLDCEKLMLQKFYNEISTIQPDFSTKISFFEFIKYHYLLASRYFSISNYDPNLNFLLPYVDLANCQGLEHRNAHWKYDPCIKILYLYATDRIKKNEPVFFELCEK